MANIYLFPREIEKRNSENTLTSNLLLQNNWVSFNQTWQTASLCVGESSLFKWRATPFPRGDYSEIAKMHSIWQHVKIFSLEPKGQILTNLAQSIIGWRGLFKWKAMLLFKAKWYWPAYLYNHSFSCAKVFLGEQCGPLGLLSCQNYVHRWNKEHIPYMEFSMDLKY